MKRIFLIILMMGFVLTACSGRKPAELGADAPTDNVPDIVGEYAVNGFDPTGQEYGGRLTITAGENPGEYKLQWLVTGGIQEGTGILEGNKLTAAWTAIAGSAETATGSASYTVTVNGELYGTRTVDGGEGEGTETAYPNE
ncbi:MAG: hypothetical protein AB1649_16935 [Chloroflexota bacterium]